MINPTTALYTRIPVWVKERVDEEAASRGVSISKIVSEKLAMTYQKRGNVSFT